LLLSITNVLNLKVGGKFVERIGSNKVYRRPSFSTTLFSFSIYD
jgi:hypothetical protein